PLLAAAASAAARGIVFHDARSLEDAGRVTTAAVTTTGTITRAELEVVEVHALTREPLEPLVAYAASAEVAAGDHPIARALRRYAQAHGIAPESVRRATHAPGRGVAATTTGGERLLVGNRQLLLGEGVSAAIAEADATRAEERGQTALFLALGGKVRAVLALRDEVRPGARAAVQRLFDQRAEVVLLSGDSRATVEALARQVDVTNVKAELLPEERGEEVRRLREQGVVAAVGVPGLDAPALEAADVPVHLGAAGSPEVERGVALTSHDIRDAAAALWIAGAARREAWRGLGIAVGVGGFLVATAALGWLPPAAAAVCAVGVDVIVLRAGARLLRRTALRLPA
ncbi:MAG: HAD-IC family P-type ATPase, partial [Myxococcota bacterium]